MGRIEVLDGVRLTQSNAWHHEHVLEDVGVVRSVGMLDPVVLLGGVVDHPGSPHHDWGVTFFHLTHVVQHVEKAAEDRNGAARHNHNPLFAVIPDLPLYFAV